MRSSGRHRISARDPGIGSREMHQPSPMVHRSWTWESEAPLSQGERLLSRTAWVILAAAIAVPAVIRLIIFGQVGVPAFRSFYEVVGMSPMNASGFAAVAILYLLARPSKGHLMATGLLAVVLESVYLANLPYDFALFDRLLRFGGGCGLAGLFGLCHLAVLGPGSGSRQRARTYLAMALVLALYPIASGALIGVLSHLNPLVFDAYGYYLEGSLGVWPSFEAARLQALEPALARPLYFVYSRLLIWLMLALALNLIYEERCYSTMFPAFAASGLVALFYAHFLPMVGIAVFVGSSGWPLGPLPPPMALKLVPAPADAPRTCVPSMHACWILIAYFSVKGISPKIRFSYIFLLLTTLVSALGPRIGHYLLDFVPAVTFAVSWQAITAKPAPGTQRLRLGIFLGGQAATIFYLLTIRWNVVFWGSHAYAFWGMSLALVVVSLLLEGKLARRCKPVSVPTEIVVEDKAAVSG